VEKDGYEMSVTSWHLDTNELEVVEQDDEGVTYLWLAEKTPQQIRYVTFARSSDCSDVYIERDDQAWGCYGGIENVQISPNGLKVFLNANGQSHLGGMNSLDISFGPDVKPSYASIEKVLRLLLSNELLLVRQ
jgi:hypothetical protein